MSAAGPMDDEFGALATWTADAVEALGGGDALPAACRGCGGPGALDWLLDRMGVEPGDSLLDVGAGVGGPAEYAARERRLRPVLVDPERAACDAARRLFGRPAVVAEGQRLPFDSGAVGAAWSLGVLCTSTEQQALLRELGRVVRPDGAIGLLVYVRTVAHLRDAPAGNHFPREADLLAMLHGAGLAAPHRAWRDDVPVADRAWHDAEARVSAEVAARHRTHVAWRAAQEQEGRIAGLLDAGDVRGLLLVARPAPG